MLCYAMLCYAIYLSIDPSIYLSIHRSIYLSIYLSIDLSIYLSNISVYLSIDLATWLCFERPTWSSLCHPIHPSEQRAKRRQDPPPPFCHAPPPPVAIRKKWIRNEFNWIKKTCWRKTPLNVTKSSYIHKEELYIAYRLGASLGKWAANSRAK